MRITKRQLKNIIREAVVLQILAEEKEREVFQTDNVDLPIPKNLVKLLDPDISPQEFMKRDAQLDKTGTPKQHATAILGFTLTYADNKEEAAMKILKLAMQLLPSIAKATDSSDKKEEE